MLQRVAVAVGVLLGLVDELLTDVAGVVEAARHRLRRAGAEAAEHDQLVALDARRLRVAVGQIRRAGQRRGAQVGEERGRRRCRVAVEPDGQELRLAGADRNSEADLLGDRRWAVDGRCCGACGISASSGCWCGISAATEPNERLDRSFMAASARCLLRRDGPIHGCVIDAVKCVVAAAGTPTPRALHHAALLLSAHAHTCTRHEGRT